VDVCFLLFSAAVLFASVDAVSGWGHPLAGAKFPGHLRKRVLDGRVVVVPAVGNTLTVIGGVSLQARECPEDTRIMLVGAQRSAT